MLSNRELVLVLWFGLFELIFGSFSQAGQSQSVTPDIRKIHVVVVAVPQFAIEEYNNPVVQSAFSDRCNELKTYFLNHLGEENVQVDQYCTKELTTRESLRHLFAIDVPNFSAHTLTLIFIMSHGEFVQFGNEFLRTDLELITSDTVTTDPSDDLKHERQFSSILFGSELMGWLERAPAGSTILTFLDTCHSGAAGSLSTSLVQFLQQQFGLRSLLFASALPQEQTYRALFTKDLMELWDGGNGCLNQDTLPNQIYTKMSSEAPLSQDEGLPVFLVRYNGPLCLGNFGKDRKLLFLYAGQDAEKHPLHYEISEDLGTSERMIIGDQLLQYTYLPIPLDSKKYVVRIRQNNNALEPFRVDLTSSGSKLIWLDRAPTPEQVARFGEIMSETAERNGSSPLEVIALKRRAAAVYVAAGLQADANRIRADLQKRGEMIAPSDSVLAIAFQPTDKVKNVTVNSSIAEKLTVAQQLHLLGDFANAATLYSDAAKKLPADDKERSAVATNAYIDYVAAGDPKDAKKTLKTFQIDTSGEVQIQLAGPPSKSKALGLAVVLNEKAVATGSGAPNSN